MAARRDIMNHITSPLYRTKKRVLYAGEAEGILKAKWFRSLRKKVNLIFTSPPFPLNRRKAYGNLKGQNYVNWLASFADIFKELLIPECFLVIELGNAWESGTPTMSVLSIEALLELKQRGDFYLCQELIWSNTARLPSPVQRVNIEGIRIKDAITRLWWLSTTPRPKADNRAESILSNVLSIPNTISNDPYLIYCKESRLKYHPTRMSPDLAKFFILFLTKEGDIVLDSFAGSNITGWTAENLGRRWRSIEKEKSYAIASRSRFPNSWLITEDIDLAQEGR